MAQSVAEIGIEGLTDVVQLSTGGSARIYRARQVDLDREVAIKVIQPGNDSEVVSRFDRERKTMGRLSLHNGIVTIHTTGLTAYGEPYLIMPYYPGGSLQDQLDAGPMQWPKAVSYIEVVAETVAMAHEKGVVHLDLKPANILLGEDGAPRITDFGIARLIDSASDDRGAGTGIAFTPGFAAPEVFLNGVNEPAADVYGLGATLWSLVAGHPPFSAPGENTGVMALLNRVVNDQLGDLRHLAPDPICDVIERAMAKQPEDRYQTGREFSTALKSASKAAVAAGGSPSRDGIFISYRRSDTEADAGRLYADLVTEFGSERLFMDVDDVALGENVATSIRSAISQSAVLLALVGPSWATERLRDGSDWVRMELETAMELGVRIVPICVRRAKMPSVQDVPHTLREFPMLNAGELEHPSWHRDLRVVLETIRNQMRS